jgi:hypothetical protein
MRYGRIIRAGDASSGVSLLSGLLIILRRLKQRQSNNAVYAPDKASVWTGSDVRAIAHDLERSTAGPAATLNNTSIPTTFHT